MLRARFESEEAAQANSDRPEQGAWWAETAKVFDGEATFRNSLAQVALKFTAPGVPDVYQGCELWDFSLVDPDNRRPVDYAALARELEGLSALYRERWPSEADWSALHRGAADGRIQPRVTWRRQRQRRPPSAQLRPAG